MTSKLFLLFLAATFFVPYSIGYGKTEVFTETKVIELNITQPRIRLSPDGQQMLVFYPSTYEIWAVDMATQLFRKDDFGQLITTLWSPNSQYLAVISTNSDGNTIYNLMIWDLTTKQSKTVATYTYINGISWHPENKFLVINADNKIQLLNLETETFQVIATEIFTVGTVGSKIVDFSPDGDLLAVLGYEQFYFWDAETYEPLSLLQDTVFCGECVFNWSWSPDGRFLVLGNVGVIDFERQTMSFDEDIPDNLSWSPNGMYLMSGMGELYDVMSQTITPYLPLNSFNSPQWTFDGKYIVYTTTTEDTSQVEVWDVDNALLAQEINYPDETLGIISLSRNAGILAITDSDGTVHILEYQGK